MTRLLTICALLATLVLLQALHGRPPEIVSTAPGDEEGNADPSSGSLPATMQQDPMAPAWTDAQIQRLTEQLKSWSQVDPVPGIDDPRPRGEEQETLRIEWICQRELLRLKGRRTASEEPVRLLRLQGGSLLAYSSLHFRSGYTEVVLPDGPVVRIPASEILATRVTPDAGEPRMLVAGGIADTLDILDGLSRTGSIDDTRWQRWLQHGGPEVLLHLLPASRARPLEKLIRKKSSEDNTELHVDTGGKTPLQLTQWRKSIRQLLREGFPTEKRIQVLDEVDSWQFWLDAYGTKVYRSRTRYLQISRELRILKLDIVKSTGF
ncbi:MAG TPA: hypothetical protein EYN40_02050 [Planctomycetes bacterium]|nr:hypothetical protein [Planctomycetota bacterium]